MLRQGSQDAHLLDGLGQRASVPRVARHTAHADHQPFFECGGHRHLHAELVGRTPTDDAELLDDIHRQLAQLPSYDYRRACALVNRERVANTDGAC